uniref:Zinc finger, CCHC-type n=1 Tax=Tanacetum cinerariifolium TaxID=118510 RepID=A0A699GSQ6_TANCI|nr:zinc finger, CCHC-type [Tanacetum cinerariifolium]
MCAKGEKSVGNSLLFIGKAGSILDWPAPLAPMLNIEKLDGNIVQKLGGSKQVGLKQLGSKQVEFKQLGVKQVWFKQLGPGVETGVHGVHDEKRVWFEVELQGDQGDHEAKVFQAGLKKDMDARSDVYVLSNGCRKCSDDNDGYYWGYTPSMFIHLFLYIDDMFFSCGYKAEIWPTKGLLDKAKGNVLGMEIVRNQSGYTLRVSHSRFYNKKLVLTLLEGHSILSLKGSLSRDCDLEKNGKWSCLYAVEIQEYQMVCTILDIASANVESRYELRLVAGIATGALVKGGSRSEVPAQVEVAAYRY